MISDPAKLEGDSGSVADPDDLYALGLPDPDPNPLDRDPDPDPSIIKQKSKKIIDSYRFVTSYDFLSLKIILNTTKALH